MTPGRKAELRALVAAVGATTPSLRNALREVLDALDAAERERDELRAACEKAREALVYIEAHERDGECGTCWGKAMDALASLPRTTEGK